MESKNCLVVLGPTASGKTALGTRLASSLDGEILSVDSRQVYRGLDIGAGKDLSEYFDVEGKPIPHHLIDIVDLNREYSLFDFQSDFYRVFEEVQGRERLPIAVGGTGLYLEAVIEGYDLRRADPDEDLRGELESLSTEELEIRFRASRDSPHNTTDLDTRERLIRAIEIAETRGEPLSIGAPEIHPLILGMEWDRAKLRERIGHRLRNRMDGGMIEEVAGLRKDGVSWARLEQLGLEYRFVSQFLQDKIKSKNDLYQKLHTAINRFAKRQLAWFRRMERRGTVIHWIPEGDFDRAMEVLDSIRWTHDSTNIF